MPWGAAIGAGAGLLGGAMNAKSSANAAKQTAEINKAPWSGAQPYVLDSFNKAQTALNGAMATGPYQGPYTAGLDPFQTQGFNTAAGFAQNQGLQGADTVFNAGVNNIGSASQFGTNAANVFNQAGQDPTQQILGNAAQYANNPYLNSQIDAASRDVTRNLNENQLTGLDASAAGSGNMNSTRTGVAQGIMQRGAADQIGDISAQMHGQAYNNGLNMAQSQYNTGIGQQMGANGQLLQAGQFGADQIGNGINLGYGAGDAMVRAGAGFQTQNQNVINGNIQQNQANQNNALDLIGKYNAIISGNFAGGGGTVQPSNMFGNIASGALAGMGLAGQWNKSNTGSNGSTVGSTSAGYQNTYGNGMDSLGSTGDYNINGSNNYSNVG